MGGTPNEGIMHGLVDRKGFNEGTPSKTAEQWSDYYHGILSKYKPPAPRLPYGQIGLNLISGQYAGDDGFLANVARSAKDPYAQFTAADDARRNLDYETRMAATKMGISREEAEAAAKAKAEADYNKKLMELKMKQAGEAGMQKDYSPQRAFETEKNKRITSASELKSFEKPNVYQKFPDATAEHDVYILRGLRDSNDPKAKEIYANRAGVGGFVPFDMKTQRFDYLAMNPGKYYYDPDNRVFVKRVPDDPSTPEDESGFFQYDPYTFQETKLPGKE